MSELKRFDPYGHAVYRAGFPVYVTRDLQGEISGWSSTKFTDGYELYTEDKMDTVRPLSTIARDIKRYWSKPYFGAVPYIDAMLELDSITDMYYADTAKEIVLYFLANANTWRGEDARRIKAELKQMAGIK